MATAQPAPAGPAAPAGKGSGLAAYFSILTAPRNAFATLARVPMWGWAAIAGLALMLIGTLIALPALQHFALAMQHARIAQLPADQQARVNAQMGSIAEIGKIAQIAGALIVPWFFWLLCALVFLIGAALSGGDARWGRAWIASVNAYVVLAVAMVLTDIILRLRGPESANTMQDMQVLPSLAPLFHGPKIVALLSSYNVLYVWFYVVCVVAMEQVMRMRRGAAIAAVFILSLIFAAYGVLTAK